MTEKTQKAKTTKVKRSGLIRMLIYLRQRFDLEEGMEDELETIEYISKNVEFKGANLWILIFAIFVASVGLNVNSTAVIIGAMLISPLMGPIMGIGLAAGINDFDLLFVVGCHGKLIKKRLRPFERSLPFICWWPIRESNPCFGLERATS